VPPAIPQTELARRICVANHPFYGQSPYGRVPCADHIRAASLHYGLLDPGNAKTLRVILGASGILDNLIAAYRAVPAGDPTVEMVIEALPALWEAIEDLSVEVRVPAGATRR
jgi:hypothetical protein